MERAYDDELRERVSYGLIPLALTVVIIADLHRST